MTGQGDIFVIIESRPFDTTPPSDVRHVQITAARAAEERPRPDEIDEVIRRVPAEGVRTLRIHYSSRLTRLPPIDRFKNLKVLEIQNRTIKDLGPLFALGHLESLTLTSVKADRLPALQGRRYNYVRLIRGNIVQLDLTARNVFCQECSHLVSFGGAEISFADVQSCKNVDLSTFAPVRGLIDLRIVGTGPVVTSFDFAVGCRDLKNLTITTLRSTTDFSALGRAPALRSAFLLVKRSMLARVAGDCPHLVISNGDVCFRGCQQMTHFDFERERAAILGV